jgi:AraC family transcriptional regulator
MCKRLDRGEFFGRTLGQRRFGAFTFTSTSYRPGERLPEHGHTRPFLCLVLAGGYHERSESSEAECQKGATAVHFEDLVHSDWFGPAGGRCVNIEFDEDLLAPLTDEVHAHPPALFYLPPACTGLQAQRVACELGLTEDPASGFALEGLAYELLALSLRRGRPQRVRDRRPGWLKQAIDLLRADHRRGRSLAGLARELGVHPAHLARAFRACEGVPVGEYSRRVRAEQARERLQSTDDDIAAVALQLGYCDQSHLSRELRARYGLSPGALRRVRPGMLRSTDR